MKRSIEQYRACSPKAMATEQSEAAITYAFEDMRSDIITLYDALAVIATMRGQCIYGSIEHMGLDHDDPRRDEYRNGSAAAFDQVADMAERVIGAKQ